jgi:hypothetical protein
MNSNTLKTTGAIVFSVLLMVAIVIYIPKPEPRSSKRHSSSKVVNTEYLSLAVQALSKANEASMTARQKLIPLANGEKIDFSPLDTANTAAIDALAKADKSIKLCNEELQKFKEEATLTILIEANTRLITSLNKISETVKALDEEFQHLKKENAKASPSPVWKATDAVKKLNNTIKKGSSALREAINAFSEYYELGPIGDSN